MSALDKFNAYYKKIRQYNQAVALLNWDMSTVAPKDSIESKVTSIGFFSTEAFRLSTAPEYGQLLDALSDPAVFDTLDEGVKVTIRREKRDFVRFQRIPEAFYTEYVETTARSEQAWEQAKRADDVAAFLPHLDKTITMTKQYYQYMEPEMDPYELMLDTFEPGMDSAAIDRIFAEMKEGLRPLLEKIAAAEKPDLSALNKTYDIQHQKAVQDYLLHYIGFNFDRGTTAESEHPFTTTLCPGDIRVTNHYMKDTPISAMFSAIHEGGHAIFEQNIDDRYQGTAVADIDMMGLHESQSRFFENVLGRNVNFWKPIYGDIQKLMPELSDVPLELFMQAVCDVRPSFIRTEADEVTYCMHIILRYELEKAIFRDNVPTEELPGLWKAKMTELLGITPATDADGILQDMHWSDGSFGYFPSYLLGSIYDGLFLEALEKEMGSVDKVLAEGRIKDITKWLNKNIHQYGSLYRSDEVIRRVCGCEISAQPLLRYFTRRYTEVYHLA